MTFDHVHGFVRVRWPKLFAILSALHLPSQWLVSSGSLPHDPDCTPTEGVLRSDR